MKLITSTAPFVLESLKSETNEEDQPQPLQALISKLTEAIEDEESAEQTRGTLNRTQQQQPTLVSTTVQTTNPNMQYF